VQLPASILNVPTSDVLADADLESKDVTLGWVDATPGWVDATPGWAHVALGWVDATPGWAHVALGWVDATPGWAHVTLGWVDVVDLVPVVPGVRPDVAAHPGLAAPHTTAPINVTANTARRIRLTSRIEVVPL
jgi:hypothetical protein